MIYQNPDIFQKKVLEEADKLPDKVLPEELKGRKDFRKERIFTIDGDTAKDFDDAVGIKKIKKMEIIYLVFT